MYTAPGGAAVMAERRDAPGRAAARRTARSVPGLCTVEGRRAPGTLARHGARASGAPCAAHLLGAPGRAPSGRGRAATRTDRATRAATAIGAWPAGPAPHVPQPLRPTASRLAPERWRRGQALHTGRSGVVGAAEPRPPEQGGGTDSPRPGPPARNERRSARFRYRQPRVRAADADPRAPRIGRTDGRSRRWRSCSRAAAAGAEGPARAGAAAAGMTAHGRGAKSQRVPAARARAGACPPRDTSAWPLPRWSGASPSVPPSPRTEAVTALCPGRRARRSRRGHRAPTPHAPAARRPRRPAPAHRARAGGRNRGHARGPSRRVRRRVAGGPS